MLCFPFLIAVVLGFGATPPERDAEPAEAPVIPAERPAVQPPRLPPKKSSARQGVRLPRPRLLVTPRELPGLRVRCGVASVDASGPGADEYRRLKAFVDSRLNTEPDDGWLYLPAIMHLVAGDSAPYAAAVERVLVGEAPYSLHFDDVAVALDWCWDSLSPAARSTAAERLVSGMTELAQTDSPFEHFLFHPKLCHVASAIALRGAFDEGSAEADRVEAVIKAAEHYFAGVLAPMLQQTGGCAPTPSIRADFEADAVFAMELWNSLRPGAWAGLNEPLGRLFDGYLWADTNWPTLTAGLVHDAGTSSPLRPGMGMSAFAAGVADVVAGRTGSPVAGYYAHTDRPQGLSTRRDAHRQWLRLVYDSASIPRLDLGSAPLARRLGNGWVLMRSSWDPGATLIGFDAGQPLLLSRQHLDAGQFQIVRKGRLAIDSGDDVSVEAIPPRGGRQHIGSQEAPFDLYARSTLAHSCVVLPNPRQPPMRIGPRWLGIPNQREAPAAAVDWAGDVRLGERGTGRLLAFGTNPRWSFASADLAKAYGTDAALLYERSLLFVHDGLLVIVDRIEAATAEIGRRWLLQLPGRPLVGGGPLDPQMRRRAEGADAGSWLYPAGDQWLSVDHDDGRLFVRSVAPAARRWHIIGGPAARSAVTLGSQRQATYVGGSADSFEHWLGLADGKDGANAWYTLGRPAALGDAFGLGGGWGRLEVEAIPEGTSTVFVHLLAPCDVATAAPPTVDATWADDRLTLKAVLDRREYRIVLKPTESPLGTIEVVGGTPDDAARAKLPGDVQDRP